MNKPCPFIKGDKVVLKDFYHAQNKHLNDVVRTVIDVEKSNQPLSGWYVLLDGPAYRKGSKGLKLDAGWAKKVVINEKEKRIQDIIQKISKQIQEKKTDKQIEASFQRHVTKVDLIACIRTILK